MRLLDSKDYVPDIILKLDFENLIIEFQSTIVDDEFSKRGLTYVAVANRDKENKKEMTLIVLSTVEESKIIKYEFAKDSVFTYRVVSLKDLDVEEIIHTVEPKIKKGLEIKAKELVLYALIPMIVEENMEKYIKRVVDNLLQVRNATDSIKNLSYGIEWLIVDKFVEDKEYRQILCDRLGDRMSLIYEYAEIKEKKALKEFVLSFLNAGTSLNEISQITGKSIKELEEILNS